MGIKQVLIAIDQLGNALLGGYADETISARCWRLHTKSKAWFRLFKFVEFLFGSGHCLESYHSELLRRQSPAEERNIKSWPY